MSIRVLVCTDGSEPSRKTARLALALSVPLRFDLTLAYAVNLRRLEYKMIPDFQVEMIHQGALSAARDLLEREAGFLRAQGVEVTSRLIEGDPGQAICAVALAEGFSLVVMGRRGQGDLQDILFGSVSNHVVHHCAVPVLVSKLAGPEPSAAGAGRRVRALVAMDGSAAGERCLDYVASLRDAREGLDLTLIHVVNPERPGLEHLPDEARYAALQKMHAAGQEILEAAAGRLRAQGFRAATRIEEGSAGRTICRVYGEDGFDLVVLGRRGQGELREILFGSVCHFVLHHCSGHTLVVP